MLTDETLKALLEGIIYIAPEPVTLDGMLKVLEGEERERVKAKLEELVADYEQGAHGIQIRQVANGYKFSTKAEHHEILRKYVKSLKAPIRLSKPALETLAVIAYRQPVTMPEIEEVRGVDSGGVIHTLLEKKLVVTSGRKSVVGRPILYRTSKDFLVHFGLKDVGELPSLKEFEELAKRALGSEFPLAEETLAGPGTSVAAEPAAAGASAESAPADLEPAPASTEAPAAESEGAPQASEPTAMPAVEEAPPSESPVPAESSPAIVEAAAVGDSEPPGGTEGGHPSDHDARTESSPAAPVEDVVTDNSEQPPDLPGEQDAAPDAATAVTTPQEAAPSAAGETNAGERQETGPSAEKPTEG